MNVVMGSDGLRARINGAWAKDKLSFLSTFGPPALEATRRMPQRHYIDLFAGPGLNRVSKTSSEEYEGSPLRAIKLKSGLTNPVVFTNAWFVNASRPDHLAVTERIQRVCGAGQNVTPREQIRCVHGDANVEIYRILDQIHPLNYVFAFADMEAPSHCNWSTIKALRIHRRHKSVDLYLLFPLEMAIRRLLSGNPESVEVNAPTLDRFYGDDRWRSLLRLREVQSQKNTLDLGREAIAMYVNRLKEHWQFVDVVADIRRAGTYRMYKMIYASNHEAGKKIAQWAMKRAPDQTRLSLGDGG